MKRNHSSKGPGRGSSSQPLVDAPAYTGAPQITYAQAPSITPKIGITDRTSSGPVGLESRGVIRLDELYALTEFKRRLGFTSATLRSARRGGLRVYYKHKHGYVYGRDWIDYVLL